MTAYSVSSIDGNRVKGVVSKIIRGLFFHEFGKTLPEKWIIKVIWITPLVEKEQKLVELAKTLKWNVIKEDTFAYGVGYVPKTDQSIWLLDFFKIPLFYVLVVDKDTAKDE